MERNISYFRRERDETKTVLLRCTRQMYENYYTGQVGGNMPVFRGVRYQRGHGLGNVISLFRRVVLPFLKNKKTFIRNALRTGKEVADDGESLKTFVKKRLRRV